MTIANFTEAHAEQAMRLAQAAYDRERAHVPALPEIQVPSLRGLAKINLGVAAFEGNEMVGFLCACGMHKRVFGTTNVNGVWSPAHNHAAVGDRARVYHRMYQAVAEKWVNAGALSHAVTLYAHDEEAKQAWFTYGFGMRFMEAVKLIEPGGAEGDFLELPRERAGELCGLNNLLIDHLGGSPCFLKYKRVSEKQAAANFAQPDIRVFAARQGGLPAAYLKLCGSGESFASRAPDMMNICGASALPEVRGTGIYANLLRYTQSVLAKEGYVRLGVDYESFNPNALYFYPKHFTVYTNSMVRRIDERGNK